MLANLSPHAAQHIGNTNVFIALLSGLDALCARRTVAFTQRKKEVLLKTMLLAVQIVVAAIQSTDISGGATLDDPSLLDYPYLSAHRMVETAITELVRTCMRF